MTSIAVTVILSWIRLMYVVAEHYYPNNTDTQEIYVMWMILWVACAVIIYVLVSAFNIVRFKRFKVITEIIIALAISFLLFKAVSNTVEVVNICLCQL